MMEKVENFLINITIIEGRHLFWPNMDSAVHVRVDNQRKCTGIRYTTDSPFFNEYFVFEFNTTLQQLIDKLITITVIRPRKIWRSKKTLGFVTLDVATVWTQPDHQFYHKWAILAAPFNDPTAGPRGYIKVDINIIRKGEVAKIPVIKVDTDEIEGNLLLPEGLATERQRVNYVFNIYRAEDLCKSKHIDSKFPPVPEKDPPSSYIEVCFAGLKVKTSLKKNLLNPVWNESLVLTELFPPLCQRIKVNLHNIDTCHDSILATRCINLRAISNDKEHGFLPTFGPAFIHFYARGSTSEGYVGKLLMSFKTELQINPTAMAKSIGVQLVPPLPEMDLWKTQSVILSGIVFNANVIDRKYSDKPITFEICFGKSDIHDNKSCTNRTNSLSPMANGKFYWYLEYGQDKPCVHLTSKLPDFRRRMYNANIISKIVEELRPKLKTIEELFLKEEYAPPSRKLEDLLLDVTDFLSSACRNYLDITHTGVADFETELDKERRNFCLREMKEMEKIAKSVYQPKMKKKSFRNIQKLLQRLELLIEEEQDCWADVFVSMISGNKKVAYSKFAARDIVYSIVDEEKGKHCGKFQSLFLQPKASKKTSARMSCKLDIMLWLGLERNKSECYDAFPPGFIVPQDFKQDGLPPYLVAQEKYYFQCRAHIYQGKFLPGSDRSGLSDPFARVIIGSECRETAVSQATLHPVWDQSLIYPKLILYGAKSYIKDNPPLIVMEVFDKDECCRNEFVGRCMFKPVIKCIEDPYKPPMFPPKLQWCSICKGSEALGDVLVVAELLELSEKVEKAHLKPTNEIIRVPSDIKPQMVKYRIEVIFWGVRELKAISCCPITKPKITLECAYVVLHSDVILNVKKNLNFTQPKRLMDISLPEQEEYAPPVCIKMFDCRSFGRYTLAGTHIASVSDFLYSPLTTEERKKRLSSRRQSFDSSISETGIHYRIRPKKIRTLSSRCKTKLKQKLKSRQCICIEKLCGLISKPCTKKGKKSKIKFKEDGQTDCFWKRCLKRICNFFCCCFAKRKKKKGSSRATKIKNYSTAEQAKAEECYCKRCLRKLYGCIFRPCRRKHEKSKKKSSNKKECWLKRLLKYFCCCCICQKSDKKECWLKRLLKWLCCCNSKKSDTKECWLKRLLKWLCNCCICQKSDKRKECWLKRLLNWLCCCKSKKSDKGESCCKRCRRKNEKSKKKSSNKQECCLKRLLKCICCCSCFRPTGEKSGKKECWLKRLLKWCCCCNSRKKKILGNKKRKSLEPEIAEYLELEDPDWWTKYRDSTENENEGLIYETSQDRPKKRGCTLKVYASELENQHEFSGFTDTLKPFQMYRGKRTGDETVDEGNIMGIFKGAIKIYRWPQSTNRSYVTSTGLPFQNGAFQEFLSNESIHFIVRIYCVKGINLRPKDINGKTDSYICVTMGSQTIKDRKNYIAKQINPVFGRCFEFKGTFSKDHAVTIAVWDWDLASSDDLIGETKIDIENRFYTRHRGQCGIASEYQEKGYCKWRDSERPSQILEKVCSRDRIDPPKYNDTSVQIMNTNFGPVKDKDNVDTDTSTEGLALCALKRWQEIPLLGCHLVPEHVETRSLYHPAKPGVEQGKLQLWVDIFPCTDLPPPQQVDISPRKPVAYELRVIVWNTDDVILQEDDFFVGEKMSDIYVKGWLTDPSEYQCTDVHYRSTTGEGSFNWRFIFRFKYISTENKLIISKKDQLFSIDETEHKSPCKLTLQVWDSDSISADDFLGTVTLELARLPRGARSPKTCTLDNLSPSAPTTNLFKIKRAKGWWPFRGLNEETKEDVLAGKIELEFELITAEEAEKNPAGIARTDPQALPKPTRPDSSFSFLRNPLKALRFIICKNRWRFIKCFIFIFLTIGILVGVYALPGYTIKKLLGFK